MGKYWGSSPLWKKIVFVILAIVVARVIWLEFLKTDDPVRDKSSESYDWGVMAGNSAVTSAKAGMSLEEACKAAIIGGAMYADNPVLNQTPPPENFNSADAQAGCMNQLRLRLGY
jgi:hypothetical protein